MVFVLSGPPQRNRRPWAHRACVPFGMVGQRPDAKNPRSCLRAHDDGGEMGLPRTLKCESLDVTHRTVSDRILAGASQALALHMKAHTAWAGRAVMPRSRKAVREAQGLTARTSPKPSSPDCHATR